MPITLFHYSNFFNLSSETRFIRLRKAEKNSKQNYGISAITAKTSFALFRTLEQTLCAANGKLIELSCSLLRFLFPLKFANHGEIHTQQLSIRKTLKQYRHIMVCAMQPVYMAFADSKTANRKCLGSKFSDSKYLDSKQKIKITYFSEKWEIFKDKILSFQ